LLTDRDEISNLHREPSIDASYQVSVQLANQGRRILEIDQSETDDGQRTPSDGKSSHCLWPLNKRCFLIIKHSYNLMKLFNVS
jgi:hypothetical protein